MELMMATRLRCQAAGSGSGRQPRGTAGHPRCGSGAAAAPAPAAGGAATGLVSQAVAVGQAVRIHRLRQRWAGCKALMLLVPLKGVLRGGGQGTATVAVAVVVLGVLGVVTMVVGRRRMTGRGM